MSRIITLLLASLLLLSCAEQTHIPPPLDKNIGAELKSYLDTHKQTPTDYIVSKFADHDVVILGEIHKIRENELLIQELIPLLYVRGIRVLATEFARREDQPLLDSLLSGATYNEALAREITFRQLAFWGFQEYVDIFKAAWQLNQQLPDSLPRFRILGMNDSPDWSIMKTQEDRDNDSLKRLVWRGGGEHLWARVVTDAVNRGDKVLVHSGMHHAFSGYKQPVVIAGIFIRFDTTRAGNYMKLELGERVMSIYLHAIWPSFWSYGGTWVFAADGQVDALFAELGPANYPAGFDLQGTPFGKLTGEKSIYSRGYENFTISTFADGWIFQCPLSQYHGVTPIENFITADNYERAKAQSPNPDLRNLSMDELNKVIADDAGQAWWMGLYQ